MSPTTDYPPQRHSRRDIVRACVELRRAGETDLSPERIVRHLGGSARPLSFVEGVCKVVFAAEDLVARNLAESISQVSVAKLRKIYPDLGGNSGSMQEVIDALREAAVAVADREPAEDDEADAEGGQTPTDRIGKELMAKIGASNAMIVAESVRGVLAEERAAADRRLAEERAAADRRLAEERSAGDQRLAAAHAAAAAQAERVRADAQGVAVAQVALARSGGRMVALTVGGLALLAGIAAGLLIARARADTPAAVAAPPATQTPAPIPSSTQTPSSTQSTAPTPTPAAPHADPAPAAKPADPPATATP